MKTNTTIESKPDSTQLKHQDSTGSRFASFSRALLGVSCVSLVSLAPSPQALAQGVNGDYEFTKAFGTLKFDGESVDIPESLVKRIAGVVKGDITIRNRKLKLKKSGTADIIEELADDLDIDVDTSVSGPSNVRLKRSGNTFSGETSRPIVVNFDGDFFDELFDDDFSGKLVTSVAAEVKNGRLKVIVRFSGDADGEDFGGRFVIIGRR